MVFVQKKLLRDHSIGTRGKRLCLSVQNCKVRGGYIGYVIDNAFLVATATLLVPYMIPVRSENTVGNKGVFFIEKWGGTNGTDNENVGGIVMKRINSNL